VLYISLTHLPFINNIYHFSLNVNMKIKKINIKIKKINYKINNINKWDLKGEMREDSFAARMAS